MNARYVLDRLAVERVLDVHVSNDLPENWLRCECGASFYWDIAKDMAICPICGAVHPEDQ